MRRIWKVAVVILLVASLLSPALAQRGLELRLGLGQSVSLGLGLEAPLERNLALRGFVDIFPSGPVFRGAGELLFKSDLGQVDQDLRGIRPYFGGGLGLEFDQNGTNLGLTLGLGVEFLLDPRTGLFLEGGYFYPFGRSGDGRLVLGATLR